MSKHINKLCKKCDEITKHRFVKNKTNGYYSCSICTEKNSKNHSQKHWFRYLAQKANSRKKENSVKITEDMLKKIYLKQQKCCALSGMGFDMKKSLYKPSLDRIDSQKGYTEDNIQLVLFIVNKMKRELRQDEFKAICFNIAQNEYYMHMPYLYGSGICGV